MRQALGWRSMLSNASAEFMNEATLAFHSRRTPVYPYAALVSSTQLLAAG